MIKKITFINPDFAPTVAGDAMQPLAFAILAGLTPRCFQIELYDERVERIPDNLETDMIAITVQSFTALRAYYLAAKYRSQGILVVLGGIHVSAMPDEAVQYCDAVVVGPAEGVWLDLLNDFKKGCLKSKYISSKELGISKLQFNRNIFKNKKYTHIVPVLFSRGCKYNCEFCSVDAVAGRRIYYRPIEAVLQEIEQLASKFIFFVDDNILNNKQQSKELFERLIDLKIKWAAQISMDACMDTDLLRLMRKSGCVSLTVGFESVNDKNLKLMKKGVNIITTYEQAIRNIRNNGILLYGCFIFGYEYDTLKLHQQTVDFAIANKFFLANFNPLMIFPATALYQRYERENRLLYNKWWLNPNYKYGSAMHRPANFSASELTESCMESRNRFNSLWCILERAIDFKANMKTLVNTLVFWKANLISKSEIKRKNCATK